MRWMGLLAGVTWDLMELEREPGFREIVIDGILVLAVAPAGDSDQLTLWCKRHGFSVGLFQGASPTIDLAHRLRRKVMVEAAQLPEKETGVLVIYAQDVLLAVNEPGDLIP